MIAPPLGCPVHLLRLLAAIPGAGAGHTGLAASALVVVDQVQVLVALRPLSPCRPRP